MMEVVIILLKTLVMIGIIIAAIELMPVILGMVFLLVGLIALVVFVVTDIMQCWFRNLFK